MSIAKLSSDAGVKYLLKTTAHGDVNVRNLTDYYTKSGNPPGAWYGSGLDGIGMAAGAVLTDDEAKAVFEAARHPVTGEPLGRPHGHRTTVHTGQGPAAGTSTRSPVAGFDLTFSVPKSASVLWALSPRPVRDKVLDAHHRAVQETLTWLESRAIGTRAGRNGVAHVPVKGAIAAAFDHWESRAGDPQLHTHLVIANRVQRTSDGAWTTMDASVLYKAVVAASERYNGLLYDELRRTLGTETELRPPLSTERNPSRELTGVDAALITEFSTRTRAIELEKDRLIRLWNLEHGKDPSDATVLKLRQRATLATRAAKTREQVPLADRLTAWRHRATGAGCRPERLVTATINRSRHRPLRDAELSPEWIQATGALVTDLVGQRRATWNRWNLLAEAERVCAGIRMATPADRTSVIDHIADASESLSVQLNDYRYAAPAHAMADIATGGRTVFDPPAGRVFTNERILAAEAAIMAASQATDGPGLDPWDAVDAVPAKAERALCTDQQDAAIRVLTSRHRLDAVTGPAGAGKTLTMKAISDGWQHVHGPGSVVALAPAAVSADVLGEALGLPAENVAKWLYESEGPGAANRARRYLSAQDALARLPLLEGGAQSRKRQRQAAQVLSGLAAEQSRWQLRPGQLVIVDEASMASTYQLAALLSQTEAAGAKMVLVGDPAQLDAIDAGGILGWLDRTGQAVRLTSLHRFTHPWESEASLQLRAGNYDGVLEYQRRGRIRAGLDSDMIDAAFTGWAADQNAGLTSILIAPDNDTVRALNQRAQDERIATGTVNTRHTLPLSDGLTAGRGDLILARRNDRSIRDSHGGFIRNGTLLTITGIPNRSGTVMCTRTDTGATITLDRHYLSRCAELGYATTAHRSQGITVDTGHIVVTEGRLTRELFYVGMTRGRNTNTAYVVEPDPDGDEVTDPTELPDWPEILGQVLAAEGAEHTATETRQELRENTDSLHQLAAEYDYLTHIAASEDLTGVLTRHLPGPVEELRRSPCWGPCVAAWKRLVGHDRLLAENELLQGLRHHGEVPDLAKVLHSRLRAAADLHGIPDGPTRWHSNRADLNNLTGQVEQRMINRTKVITSRIPSSQEPWTQELAPQLQGITDPDTRRRTFQEILIYRDRWAVTNSTQPLGSLSDWDEPQMKDQHHRLKAKLATATPTPTSPDPATVHPYQMSTSPRNMGLQI